MDDKDRNDGQGASCGCGGGSCCSGPGKWIWIALVVAVAVVLLSRSNTLKPGSSALAGKEPSATAEAKKAAPTSAATGSPEKAKPLPRLVDLGAGKCTPCKLMAPILKELGEKYAGQLNVEFIDVWENPEAGKTYGINVIPTQIFYDPSGKELFRHEGFIGKKDILAKWREFGVELTPAD